MRFGYIRKIILSSFISPMLCTSKLIFIVDLPAREKTTTIPRKSRLTRCEIKNLLYSERKMKLINDLDLSNCFICAFNTCCLLAVALPALTLSSDAP